MIDLDRLAALRAACDALEVGDLATVVALIESRAERGPAEDALVLVATGLLLEADGQLDAAVSHVERATALDVPIPALIEQVGRFFQRRGRPRQAHHAFLTLDLLAPGGPPALHEVGSWEELPRYAPRFLRQMMDDGRPLTYRTAGHKNSLVVRLGMAGASIILAALDGHGARTATRRPLVALIDHARQRGRAFVEIMPSRPVPSRPPRLRGYPREDASIKRTRSFFSCVLDDVVVTSHSNVLLSDAVALLDFQGDELSLDPDLAVDPLVVARDGDHVYLTEPADTSALTSIPEAFWLTGVHSSEFGDWMLEFLPKVWAMMDRPGSREVPILIDDDMPVQHTAALRCFLGDGHPLLTLDHRTSVRVERLWVVSQLMYLAVGPRPGPPDHSPGPGLDPAGFARLMARATESLAALEHPDGPRRVYLIRRPTQHRRLVNAAEVDVILARHGFEAIDLGELSFDEQIRIVRGAKHIVAQDGSAMLMTLLGKPGLRIGGLAQPTPEEWHWYADACAVLGQELTVILGRDVRDHSVYYWMSDYEIDPDDLEAYLQTDSRARREP